MVHSDLPLFGKREPSEKPVEEKHSIKSVADWQRAASVLEKSLNAEYEMSTIPGFFPMLRKYSMEALKDKGGHTILMPASEAVHAPAATSNHMGFWRLNELNAGTTTTEAPGVVVGTPVVGLQKTVVKQLYVDGFLACLKEVYQAPWQTVRALANRHRVFPLFLVGEQLALVVSPVIVNEDSWKVGKYEPR